LRVQGPPRLIVVAGPNGAGKSTYSRGAFGNGFLLLDPDRYGLRPGVRDPVAAGRLVVRRAYDALANGESFVLETTLSGRFPLSIVRTARERGFEITLLYVGVDDPEECIRRVRRRVALGGHDVPEADVRRRFVRSIAALPKALSHADRVALHDNGNAAPYRLVARRDDDGLTVSSDIPRWALEGVTALRASAPDPGGNRLR
jgi:predicted ABC-type ATPase